MLRKTRDKIPARCQLLVNPNLSFRVIRKGKKQVLTVRKINISRKDLNFETEYLNLMFFSKPDDNSISSMGRFGSIHK